MAACNDIIITIQNYNPLNTYTVTIRLKGSVVDRGSYAAPPQLIKIATGPQVIFTNLIEGQYEAIIETQCATGGVSLGSWQDVIGALCVPPLGVTVASIAGTTATINWTGGVVNNIFQYSINEDDWIDAAAYNTQALTGLVAGRVYVVRVRRKCSAVVFSLPASVAFATLVAVPTFTVSIIRKICIGDTYDGYLVRFNFTGGLIAVGSRYRIIYTDFYGDPTILVDRTVLVGETLTEVIMSIVNIFNHVNLVLDPANTFGAFDIVSKQQKSAYGYVKCQDVDMVNAFTVSII